MNHNILSLADINNIKLPYILKGQTIFTSGVHNNVNYTVEEIRKTYYNTNWKDQRIISLYIDHHDDWMVDPNTGQNKQVGASVENWLGEVRNVRYNDGRIVGDLYIVDRDTAVKLAFGARFGISPTGHWIGSQMNARDFQIRNFAMVVNPAIKANYIGMCTQGFCNNFAMSQRFDMEQWNTKYVNDLPDSAFAYISPGGKADEEGKTTPRSLRHLPYKDASGKLDAAHVRNALARLPQTHIPASAKQQAQAKLRKAAQSLGIKTGEDMEADLEGIREDIRGIVTPLSEKVEAMTARITALEAAAKPPVPKKDETTGVPPTAPDADEKKKKDEEVDMESLLTEAVENAALASFIKEKKKEGMDMKTIAKGWEAEKGRMSTQLASRVEKLESKIAALEGTDGEGEQAGADSNTDTAKPKEGADTQPSGTQPEGTPAKPPVTNKPKEQEAENIAQMNTMHEASVEFANWLMGGGQR